MTFMMMKIMNSHEYCYQMVNKITKNLSNLIKNEII